MIEISEHCVAWNNKELHVLIISVGKLGVLTSFINIGCPCIAYIHKLNKVNLLIFVAWYLHYSFV